jgi:hypothetical protein
MKDTLIIDYIGLVETLQERNACITAKKSEELANENERLRAALKSHMQSGCNCAFCRDARLALEKK